MRLVSFSLLSVSLIFASVVCAEDRPQQNKATTTPSAQHSETGQVTTQKPEQKGFLHRKPEPSTEDLDQEEELDFPDDDEMAEDDSR